jgi:SAM-dependent methyltransferase
MTSFTAPGAPVGFEDGPNEPFADSAPVAWREAPLLCPESCMAYHRVWQYMRWLGLITSIRTNSEFLVRTFEPKARDHRRVLVSGTADYGMLAHLHHAYGAAPLQATVLDLCPTPLLLNRWYAKRAGRVVQTIQTDVLSYTTNEPFDLIATHNFLGRFDDPARARLVATWYRLLRPGGLVVTTQRVRPRASATVSRYTPEEAAALAVRAYEAATHAGIPSPDAAELAQVVRQYALAKNSHVIRSPAQITGVFEACGFTVDVVDEGGGAVERYADRPSSTAGVDTFRMRLVARKARG